MPRNLTNRDQVATTHRAMDAYPADARNVARHRRRAVVAQARRCFAAGRGLRARFADIRRRLDRLCS
jgi:hypothetical protein